MLKVQNKISESKIIEVQCLLVDKPFLSIGQIAICTNLTRNQVQMIKTGIIDRNRVVEKCPQCGAKVKMPCMGCSLKNRYITS